MSRWSYTSLYKHKANTDVAFQVIKQFYAEEKELWKLKVCWFWVGKASYKPYCSNIIQRIEIPKANKINWVRLTT